MKVDLDEVERKARADPVSSDVTIALVARIRELEAVAAVAYDLTHEEGALSLQVSDTVDAEDIDKIERMSDALLQLGRLHRKGVVLP